MKKIKGNVDKPGRTGGPFVGWPDGRELGLDVGALEVGRTCDAIVHI